MGATPAGRRMREPSRGGRCGRSRSRVFGRGDGGTATGVMRCLGTRRDEPLRSRRAGDLDDDRRRRTADRRPLGGARRSCGRGLGDGPATTAMTGRLPVRSRLLGGGRSRLGDRLLDGRGDAASDSGRSLGDRGRDGRRRGGAALDGPAHGGGRPLHGVDGRRNSALRRRRDRGDRRSLPAQRAVGLRGARCGGAQSARQQQTRKTHPPRGASSSCPHQHSE